MPHSAQDARIPEEGGRARFLWPLLAVFAVAVPAALPVVEKRASLADPQLWLVVLASLAGYAVAVEKITQEHFAESRLRTRMLVWVTAAALFLGSVIVLIEFRPTPPLARMAGDRDVAVAGFAAADGKQDQQELDDFASGFALAAKSQVPSLTDVGDYVKKAGLPLKELGSSDDSNLEQKTATFADKADAEIVVAGLARTEPIGSQIHLLPAVYINSDQAGNVPELAGWYVGKEFVLKSNWTTLKGMKENVRTMLTRQVGALNEFLDAVDAWRAGDPAEAGRILDGLLDPKRQADTNRFVPSDLALLFHGAAADDHAVTQKGTDRTKLLETARKDYSRIIEDTKTSNRPGTRAKARARATLSLQANAYRRAIDPEKPCQRNAAQAADLKKVSETLKALADENNELTDLGRLKAVVNRAQVEHCLIFAGAAVDDGIVLKAVEKLSESQNVKGAGELLALAESFAADLAYRSGNTSDAIKHIRNAIEHGQDQLYRARWHGVLVILSLEACDGQTASQVHEEALKQFDAAKEALGQNPDEARTEYQEETRTKYEKDRAEALVNFPKNCSKRRGTGE